MLDERIDLHPIAFTLRRREVCFVRIGESLFISRPARQSKTTSHSFKSERDANPSF
jgi:hypothetical protein